MIMGRKKQITDSMLEKMKIDHWEKNLSIRQIAATFGFSESSIPECFDRNNIPRKTRSQSMKTAFKHHPDMFDSFKKCKNEPLFSRKEIYKIKKRIISENITCTEIADDLGCHRSTITKSFHRYGISIPYKTIKTIGDKRAAQGREKIESHIGVYEDDVILHLKSHRFNVSPQYPVSIFNADIAINKNILIEVFNSPHTPHKRSHQKNKIKTYIRHGYRVIYFCVNSSVDHDLKEPLEILLKEIKRSEKYIMIRSKSYKGPKVLRFNEI